MRLLVNLWLLPVLLQGASVAGFRVLSDDPGAWPQVLSSVGFHQETSGPAQITVLRAGALAAPEWSTRVAQGAFLILEGDSSLAQMFGFQATSERVRVLSVEDVHRPKLSIVWEKALELPKFAMPRGARVFSKERWTGAPLVAGMRFGSGGLLWVAVPLGEHGYERFPYILQALADLGLEPPFRSARLWAFFDSSYRSRVDLDYFARRWRAAGIAALHVAAWHFYERDPQQDAYLRSLIEACHREGILVYAWLELPHVSEKFWDEHPAWREKTAVLQDAHLDWRKLMNLQNPGCFGQVKKGIEDLIKRFDWDGVNLAELYFESLEGLANPARFTPMNAEVRREFQETHGFDPIEIFRARKDEASRRAYLGFRASLAGRMQVQWLDTIGQVRREKPYLDLVLTHVDDRFDQGMRDAIGADAAQVLPLIPKYRFTFLVEDPATIWNLGPQRYPEIAKRYAAITPHTERLAVDINIVDRYQDVYPTKQQTGGELFQLVHLASGAFPRIALYFENSLLAPDIPLLSSAAAAVRRVEKIGPKLVVDSVYGVGVPWIGRALVDGNPWPVRDDRTVWLPSGAHVLERATSSQTRELRLLWLNGYLDSAGYLGDGKIEFSYHSQSRAAAILSRPPSQCQVDGVTAEVERGGPATLLLPPGQHIVTIRAE